MAGVVFEQSVKKVKAMLFEIWDEPAGSFAAPFRKRCLEVWEGGHAGPGAFIGCAKDPVRER